MEFHPQLPAELLSQQFGHSLLALAKCPCNRRADRPNGGRQRINQMIAGTLEKELLSRA